MMGPIREAIGDGVNVWYGCWAFLCLDLANGRINERCKVKHERLHLSFAQPGFGC